MFITGTIAAIAAASTFTLVTTALSIGYQLYQANKMKKAQASAAAARAAAAEARKGFEGTKQDQIMNLPVLYGRNMVGSAVTDYKTKGNFVYSAPGDASSSSGFIQDSNNYIQVTVAGTTGQPLTEEGQSGNNIVNITSITTQIVFGGVTVNTEQVTSTGRTFRNGIYLAESFEAYRVSIPSQQVGNFSYYAGDETRVSDTVYKFKIRRDGASGTHTFSQGLSGSAGGAKNEYLFTQNALSFSGISRVVDVRVDGKRYGHEDFVTGLRIDTFSNGGVSPLASVNGFNTTNLFTNTCSATCVFKLNRDEPQYSQGIPKVEFFVEGQKIYDVELDTGVYSLSATKAYSNNPARVLLDYLINDKYGRGLNLTQVDLESFYNSKLICDEVVMTNATTPGVVNPNNLSDIKRYEINHIVDTTNPIRDNINQILESMGQATLLWTGGQYKLNVSYPTEQPTVANGQVDARHVFTDDEVIMDEVSLKWPNAQDRFNQITVTFPNAFEDFKDDSVTWPPFSTDATSPYQVYLTEDNYEELRSTIQPIGITDPYHAQAKAEEMVRGSRSIHSLSVTFSRKALLMEPGDYFIFSSAALDIAEGVYRVESIKINPDLSIAVEAFYFEHTVLAWNTANDEAYSSTFVSPDVVNPIENFALSITGLDAFDLGSLSWDYDDDPGNGNYIYKVAYKVSSDTAYISLSTNLNKFGSFQKLEGIETNSVYDFRVSAVTPLGEKVSEVFLLNQTINKAPNTMESLSITEEIYVTNRAAGAKSKAILVWSPDNTGIISYYTLVEYKLQSESTYTTFDTMTSDYANVLDLSPGNYDFRVTPFSAYDFAGTPLVVQHAIVGLSAVPNNPAGFTGNINEGQINLSWDLPTDLDVLYGGTCEIRFHTAIDAVASWDTASVLVDSLSGNTNNKTVPTLKGTFFIKLKDSVGNYSVSADSFTSTFEDLTFNQIETLDEAAAGFLGTKTNCSVVGGDLTMDVAVSEMIYDFNSYVDLGETVTARVVPNIVASVTNNGVLVEDYVLVSALPSFAGPVKNANLRILMSYTTDDPAGTPTYSPYELLTISSVEARALRFKFIGTGLDTNTAITVTELSILIDKKDIIKYGTSTSSSSADTTVTFPTAFYGGPGGTDAPTIAMNVIGGSVGDFTHITARDKASFTYSVYTANTSIRVARTIDFQAIGQ